MKCADCGNPLKNGEGLMCARCRAICDRVARCGTEPKGVNAKPETKTIEELEREYDDLCERDEYTEKWASYKRQDLRTKLDIAKHTAQGNPDWRPWKP